MHLAEEGVAVDRERRLDHLVTERDNKVARLRKSGRFEATTEMSRLAECDVISICRWGDGLSGV